MRLPTALSVLCLLPAPTFGSQVLFDAHLHYDADHTAQHTPADILTILDRHRISQAAITALPPDHALVLHRIAPERIVPLLGVYRTPGDKQQWWRDETLPAWVASQLTDARWRGVGELHLFAAERHSPVFARVVTLATARGLPLLVHADPVVIDKLFEHAPTATVIWAHAGAYPYPELLRDYLDRYPRLHVDLSVRDERIAPDGNLATDWAWLLIEYKDRFLVGVDTYRAARWDDYGVVVTQIRHWLEQLPTDVAESISRRNAERLFTQTQP